MDDTTAVMATTAFVTIIVQGVSSFLFFLDCIAFDPVTHAYVIVD